MRQDDRTRILSAMPNRSSNPTRKAGAEKLGRSPVTGHFVLKPATEKGRTLSPETIREAVKALASRAG